MTTLEVVTFATAVVGAITGVGGLILGVQNHRHQLRESQTRLRVIPKLAFPGPSDEMVSEVFFSDQVAWALKRLKAYMCVEVKNLSATPKTIFEIGLVDDNGVRIPWREPEWMEPQQSFPMVLQPDETGTAYVRILPEDYAQLYGCGFARTDCGEEFQGRSPIIADFIAKLKDNRLARTEAYSS